MRYTMAVDEFDDLLEDFGRSPSILQRLMHGVYATLPVVTATGLFSRVFVVDITNSMLTLALAIVASTVLMAMAYHNLAFARGAIMRRAAAPPSRGAFRGRANEFEAAKISFEKCISSAAFWYSCGYNNCIFLLVAPLLGVYLLADKLSGDLNFLVSASAAASLALFNSKSALKAIGE